MKKMTFIMITAASMLFASPPQSQGMKTVCAQKKCKKNVCKKKTCQTKNNKMRKGTKGMGSAFLIQQGLPHLGKMIMPYMDDPAFGLSKEQKEKLNTLKASTMGVMRKIMPQVNALRKEIVDASMSGTRSEALKEKVAKLALLQGTATMTQLKCIEKTKDILSKDQLVYLLMHKKSKKRDRQKAPKKMMRFQNAK